MAEWHLDDAGRSVLVLAAWLLAVAVRRMTGISLAARPFEMDTGISLAGFSLPRRPGDSYYKINLMRMKLASEKTCQIQIYEII